ncbi:MAG: hypothetical protein AAF821_17730 [Cyanobacteria bacterium P01_D01_bin.156]
MPRLSKRAFKILDAEMRRLCQDDPVANVRRDVAAKQLQQFCKTSGPRLTIEELRKVIGELFPEFDDKILQKAARVNQPSAMLSGLTRVGQVTLGLGAIAGSLWFINLPYPMIRWPIARIAPILLLPSFMQMDHHYRQALIHTEQADQLINKATTVQDFELGAQKADQAQQHLDRLPVWFLGYYPQRYCSLFQCGWKFTLDEFEDARALIGRMDAQIFQEQNALALLDNSSNQVIESQNKLKSGEVASQIDILQDWQQAMDQLREIPSETLAGRLAQTKLVAYERDYKTVASQTANVGQSNTLLAAAQQFANAAIQEGQNPPHSVEKWDRIATLWEDALKELEQIRPNEPDYVKAQGLKAGYQVNLGQIRERQKSQAMAVKLVQSAENDINKLIEKSGSQRPEKTIADVNQIITTLERVPPGTTVTQDAQYLIQRANAYLGKAN